MKKNLIFICLGVIIVLVGIWGWKQFSPISTSLIFKKSQTLPEVLHTENEENSSLLTLGREILELLSVKDMAGLSLYVGEELYFLPYPFMQSSDRFVMQMFFARELAELPSLTGEYLRGYGDGNGEPMKLTFNDYYNQFIRDADYLTAPEIFQGTEVATRGNTIMQLADLFPGSEIIEYHIPGTIEGFDGIDRKSLYLVFVQENGSWELKAIAHGAWTI
ncbi:hypothetical protein AGMMS50249_7920 [candidate division SR1 bacterium]|nr:hypothetical protein AGMMS50249_7920 [candidate division SR1 bacterium]